MLLLIAMLIGGSACAMDSPVSAPRCQVIGAGHLPPDSGGGDAICAAIQAAAHKQAPGIAFSVEVRVQSASAMSAIVRLDNGQALPEQRMAVSDRQLNRGSIERFAAAVAAEIGKAANR
jgi:hypothetical protein